MLCAKTDIFRLHFVIPDNTAGLLCYWREFGRKSCVFHRKAVSLPTEIYIHDLFNVETMSNDRRRHITPTHRIGRHIAAVAITLIALTACHNLPPFGGIRGGFRGGWVGSTPSSTPDPTLP